MNEPGTLHSQHMKKKILVIEDDSEIMDITTIVLNINNFEVFGIDGTEDILGLVKIQKPDLILTDYMLPGLTGGQICKRIKTNADTKDIPVVLMSAYSKQAIDIGKFQYDAFVKKPFDINYLITVINKFIN